MGKKAKSEVEEEMNLPTASTQTQQKLNGSVSQISQEKTTTTTSNSKKETSAERRAAALNKYRMKRKMLCFSKKIRYASRKQLAEARPRNKGQFVRCNERTTEATEVTEATEATEATVSMKRAKY